MITCFISQRLVVCAQKLRLKVIVSESLPKNIIYSPWKGIESRYSHKNKDNLMQWKEEILLDNEFLKVNCPHFNDS